MDDLKLEELARQERNRYYREYRARNPEKVKEANRRYWAKRAAKRASGGADIENISEEGGSDGRKGDR